MALARMMSGAGLKQLHAKVLQTLPREGAPKTVDASLDEIRVVQRSDLFKYAGSQAKGDVGAAYDILSQVQNKLMPARVASPSSFMIELWQLLPNFATALVPDAEAKGKKNKQIMGQAAVDHMWQTISTTPEDTVSQRDVDQLGVWAWLLKKEEQQQLHALSMRLLNTKQATPAKRSLKPAEHKTSKKAKCKQLEPEHNTALAFLGVK
eukprot:6474682-Amphidinium_carterae.1